MRASSWLFVAATSVGACYDFDPLERARPPDGSMAGAMAANGALQDLRGGDLPGALSVKAKAVCDSFLEP